MHGQKKQIVMKVFAVLCFKDFYSHSNWVELGNNIPYGALINSEQTLNTLAGLCLLSEEHKSAAHLCFTWIRMWMWQHIYLMLHADTPCLAFTADINTPTCRSCEGDNCEDNILPELLNQGLLTSGYFGLFSSKKPPGNLKTSAASFEQSRTVWQCAKHKCPHWLEGKCSHGGFFDRTSRTEPVGGINKDTVDSNHGSLHPKAADLAVLATMDLLEELRVAVGDRRFLQ